MNKQPLPEQPKTIELPKVTVPGNTIDAILAEVRATREEVRGVAANVDLLTNHVDVLSNRVSLVERRQDEADSRTAKHSGGLVRESSHNRDQDSAIAEIVTTVQSLKETQETQLDLLNRIDNRATELLKNPKVVALLVAVWSFAMTWLARHT